MESALIAYQPLNLKEQVKGDQANLICQNLEDIFGDEGPRERQTSEVNNLIKSII